MRISAGILAVALAFLAGLAIQPLYRRWNSVEPKVQAPEPATAGPVSFETGAPSFRVKFSPLAGPAPAEDRAPQLASVAARDIEKIRSLTGREARIRGRVFRVGHSAKSNTYFLDFGPSRESLTAVIFKSAAELFEQSPKQFENREVEIIGFIKDHPQYGLEVILEHPGQIKILN